MTKPINKILMSIPGAILTLLFTMSPCYGGAWTMEKGKFYDRLAVNYYFTDENFNKNGHREDSPDNGEFSDFNISNYIEYGITDRLTIINSFYYKEIHKEDDFKDTKTRGIGDIDIACKFRPIERSGGVLSIQSLVKIPEAYDKDDDLTLGNGQYDVEFRLLYGQSLRPYIPGYYNFEAGYRWRFEDPSDEIRYIVEFGMDFTKQFYGRIKLDGIYNMDNGKDLDSSGNPTITNNYDLGKLDATLGYKISKHLGCEVSYTPEIFGENTASGATYTFALTFQNK